MNMRNFSVYLPLLGAIACGPSAPRNETAKPGIEARPAAYTDVARNGIIERKYPTHTCLIDDRSNLHIFFYCDLESNGKGLDSVSRVHLVRATGQGGQDRWIDGTTDYATDAFPDGFYLEGIFSPMTKPLERKSPEFRALGRDYAQAQRNFNR